MLKAWPACVLIAVLTCFLEHLIPLSILLIQANVSVNGSTTPKSFGKMHPHHFENLRTSGQIELPDDAVNSVVQMLLKHLFWSYKLQYILFYIVMGHRLYNWARNKGSNKDFGCVWRCSIRSVQHSVCGTCWEGFPTEYIFWSYRHP